MSPRTAPVSASTIVNESGLVGAKRRARCGVVAAAPDEAGLRPSKLREVGRALEGGVTEGRAVGVVEGRLVGGGQDVAVEDAVIRVVEDRRLDSPAEQRLRLAHEVLVERVLAGDENREPVSAPAGASPLLAQAGDRAGEADRDRAVEQADVDSELERVGRRHAQQLALDQPPLDLAALLRRVSGAIGSEPRAVLRVDAGRL